jgi:menaquinone-dependent protoporphyrinogen IX oxidase
MTMTTHRRTRNAGFFIEVMIFCLFLSPSFAQDSVSKSPDATLQNEKPFVVYYSRTGKAQMVATALKNQLGCEMGAILSDSKKGVFTIMLDQVFNRNDCQQPFPVNLKKYNPVIIVSPIWFMRLSSPARTFIKKTDLKGKDAYIFTTSGGPLPESRKTSIKKFVTEYGMNVKEVISLQIGKKTQADFDKEIQEKLKMISLKQVAVKQQ